MKRRSITALAIALSLVALALAPQFQPVLRPLLLMAMAVSFCALGLLILLRAGQVSFGHALYFACGAYTVAFGARHVNAEMLTVTIMAVVCGTLLSMALGVLLSRYRDIFYAMLNLAFSMVGYTLLLKLYELTGGSDGISVRVTHLAGAEIDAQRFGWTLYYYAVALMGVVLLLVARYLNSPPGQALAALKTNETRLEYLGISGRLVLYTGHVVSAALASLGGAIAAMATGHVTPEMAYWSRSAEFVFVAILGGIGNVVGALAGALSFELIRTTASAYAANSWQLILGMVLVLIVLFAPKGLHGMVQQIFRRNGDAQ